MKFIVLVVVALSHMFLVQTAGAQLRVVASIKPIHSLVAAVMGNTGTPVLLLQGGQSPHSHTLRPSQASTLAKAEVVFWVGHNLESFLEKPIETIGRTARSVELIEAAGLHHIDLEHGAGVHAGHDHGAVDPHIWLDPVNAKILIATIADVLADADSSNRAIYKENARAVSDKLEQLMDETSTLIASVRDRKYIVYHDAYRHFERRFEVHNSGVILAQPDAPVGAARLKKIRDAVNQTHVVCVFSEHQSKQSLLDVITAGTDVKVALLDPIGLDIAVGPNQYFQLIRALARSIQTCLADSE